MHDAGARNQFRTAYAAPPVALGVTCPECDAAPGQPCISGDVCGPTVGVMAEPHPERVRAAEGDR